MARNAKLDLAKRQAVGIYRKASPNAFINKGVPVHSGGDYRTPEGAKSVYVSGRAAPVDVTGHRVTVCKPCTTSSKRYVGVATCGGKRSQATPQNRAHMNTFAGRERQGPGAVVRWADYRPNEQTLIPRAK